MLHEVDPSAGSSSQVGLRFQCATQLQAEAVHRALRAQFPTVSKIMSSYHAGFSHFVYVTASAAAVEHAWPAIEAAAGSTAPPAGAGNRTANPPAPTFRDWQRQFRAAIGTVQHELASTPEVAPEVSLEWVAQQVVAGHATEVEAFLLHQSALNPASALRAQIGLFAETGQSDRIVALCEARRDDVLALPMSGLLAEQLIGAYLTIAERTGSLAIAADARQLGRALLPELERMRQAAGVRALLASAPGRANTSAVDAATTDEQLAGLLEIAPEERIPALQQLRSGHPQATNVTLALADSLAAVDQPDQALGLYDTAHVATVEAQEQLLQQRAELLLGERRYQAIVDLLGGVERTPAQTGLLGVALLELGREEEGLASLDEAWQAGERGETVALALARFWRQPISERAAEPYRALLDHQSSALDGQDYLAIAQLADYKDLAGDLSDEALLQHYERFAAHAGHADLRAPEALDALRRRLDLARRVGNQGQLIAASADLLEALAAQQRADDLLAVVKDLHDDQQSGRLSREDTFHLLEALEPYAAVVPGLDRALVNDYGAIAMEECRWALRRVRPMPAYVRDLQRALHFLSRPVADELAAYLESECRALTQRDQPVPTDLLEPEMAADLAGCRLALVGGEERVRRAVLDELQHRYGLREAVEVGPAREAHFAAASVLAKLGGCDVIAVITGFIGHDLSDVVNDLERKGALRGRILRLACRGKSGIVREIVAGTGQ